MAFCSKLTKKKKKDQDKKGTFHDGKGSNPVLNKYATNNIASKCKTNVLTELKEETDKTSILVGDSNIHVCRDGTSKHL